MEGSESRSRDVGKSCEFIGSFKSEIKKQDFQWKVGNNPELELMGSYTVKGITREPRKTEQDQSNYRIMKISELELYNN